MYKIELLNICFKDIKYFKSIKLLARSFKSIKRPREKVTGKIRKLNQVENPYNYIYTVLNHHLFEYLTLIINIFSNNRLSYITKLKENAD